MHASIWNLLLVAQIAQPPATATPNAHPSVETPPPAMEQPPPPTSVAEPKTEPQSKLAVLGIRAEGIESMANTLLDVLVTEVAKTERFEVISKNEIEAMLGLERMKDMVGCDEMSCMAEIGGALGVERIVAGSVAKMENAYVVNLQLINTTYGNVENRVSMSWKGPQLEIVKVIGAATQQLVLPFNDKKPGTLEVTQLPAEAEVFVDNKPAQARIEKLEIGPHVLKISAEGHYDKVTPFVVKSGEALSLDGALEPISVSVGEVQDFSVGAEFEFHFITNDFLSSPMLMLITLQGTYRILPRWLRAGVRGQVGVGDTGVLYKDEPWPNATSYHDEYLDWSLAAGLMAASSLLYEENTYELSVEAGLDLHYRPLVIMSYGLPDQYSVATGADNKPRKTTIGMHMGATFDYFISPLLTLGIGIRYYHVPGYDIVFNGEELSRSLSAVSLSPRFSVHF